MGPNLRYVSRKYETASLRRRFLVISSIRMTVSGERRPCAVGKDGKVSVPERTELDRGRDEDESLCFFLLFGVDFFVPGAVRMLFAAMGGVWDVGEEGGRYMFRKLALVWRLDFAPIEGS